MKYRILTEEEMKIFDKDFNYFLIANGVKNEEWLEMNKTNLEGATKLVEMFSDSILQIVYEKVEFLEHRMKDSCMVFRFLKEEIELISLNSKNKNIDFSTPESIHDALKNNGSEVQYFLVKKKYLKEREAEIHEMIENGCVNSSKEFWDSLKLALD